MSVSIRISLNSQLFVRDPQDTVLGRNIIQNSIELINELGFEAFTFKKLAKKIDSTEASVYRYFENKHILLIYLVSWYWEWLSFQIDMNTLNINDSQKKLSIVIHTLVQSFQDTNAIKFVNESALRTIVIEEGSKAIHTKNVDIENNKGFFESFKNLIDKISDIILHIKPEFPYSHTLSSTIIDLSLNHIFFAEHIPKITDVVIKDENLSEVTSMIEFFTGKILDLNLTLK